MEGADFTSLKPLLKQYDVNVVRVTPISPGRFRLDTPEQRYEGRVVSQPAAELRMWLTDYLASRGFRRTQRFLANRYHERFVHVPASDTFPGTGVQVFYMTDCWMGARLAASHQDITDGVENLADLHVAMTGFSNHHDNLDLGDARYALWEDSLARGAKWLGIERILLRERSNTATDAELAGWLSRWEELGQRVVQSFDDVGYKEVAKKWSEDVHIAWNQYRLPNLVRSSENRVATLQTMNPVKDSKLYDVVTFCLDICEQGHSDAVREVVTRYSKRVPLEPEELRIALLYTAFPHLAFRVVRQHRAQHELEASWTRKAEQHYQAAQRLLSLACGPRR